MRDSRYGTADRRHRRCFFPIACFLITLVSCAPSHELMKDGMKSPPAEEVNQATASAPMPWLLEPAERWLRDFSGSQRGTEIPKPVSKLEDQGIGVKTRVHDLFDRWKLDQKITAGRGTYYVNVTGECAAGIELDFALTAEQWLDPRTRADYYRRVDTLIERVAEILLADFGKKLEGEEREFFLRALKTLAWQESKWQHYLRYRDWFFVIVSGGSYNKLDDWGITQIARSSFQPEVLLNENFFESKGYCSISSGLYYGFMEYYYCYLEARENPENGPGLFNKIVGAYNRYSSGYSSSCFALADDQGYRDYQIRAMGGFQDKFIARPWEVFFDSEGGN
ncbi:hypothetical protein ACFL0G_04755 [Candidatus Zixiibacteriota bacterium]